MIKRFLIGALAVAIVFATPGVNVSAQEESALNLWKMGIEEEPASVEVKDTYSTGDFEYTMSGGTATITGYTGSGGAVTIPGTISGMSVAVGERAFENNSNITSLTLSSGVVRIDYCAFYSCDKLTSVHIPASVSYIERSAFSGCEKLSNISIDSSNSSYKVVGGVLFNMSGTELMCYPAGSSAEKYTVPTTVTKICESAFDDCSYLKYIEIPDSVSYISDYAFANCAALKEITFPSKITIIRPSTCFQCSSLENVVIQEGVTYIDQYAFGNCMALKTVTIPKSVETIASYAFRQCWSITDVYYAGSESDWNNMYVYSYNEMLEFATMHYNYVTGVQAFVERMYTVVLNRSSDEAGLNNWVAVLKAGTHDGAGIAAEFITGEEFKMRGLSNSEYVDVLYRTFFGREADSEGKSLWVSTLDAGFSREYVLAQFVNLDEFKLLCASFGIERGVMFENGVAANPGISKFVNRLYETVLGRDADATGLYNWAFGLTMKSETAKSAAKNFFGSQEYTMKNTSNTTYVSDLYTVFMNRGADSEGLAVWAAALDDGMSREQVLESFAGSAEFKMIAAGYGLE